MRLKFDETSMTSERGKVRKIKREGVKHVSLDPLGLNVHIMAQFYIIIVNTGFDRYSTNTISCVSLLSIRLI